MLLIQSVVSLWVVSSATAQANQPSIPDQVLNNLRHAPVGRHTLDALDLPEAYLRRVGDRILQTSYEGQFRVVVPDGSNASASTSIAEPPPIDGMEDGSAATGSIWPTLIMIAIAGCSLAVIILVIQAWRARR